MKVINKKKISLITSDAYCLDQKYIQLSDFDYEQIWIVDVCIN